MGIEIIRLGESQEKTQAGIQSQELVQLSFRDYAVSAPSMFIWLMLGFRDRPLFPWWQYDQSIDQDIQSLNDLWSISTPQGLFDCLFLSCLKKFAGSNFFAILPGNIKSE